MSKEKTSVPSAANSNTKTDKVSTKLDAAMQAVSKASIHFEEVLLKYRKAEKDNSEKAVLYPLRAAAKIAKAQLKIKKVTYKLLEFEHKMAQKKAKTQGEASVASKAKATKKTEKPASAPKPTRSRQPKVKAKAAAE